MPLIIGVTGSIATGKSLVCRTLTEMGATHYDVDKFVHEIYNPGTPTFDKLVAIFGNEIVGKDGYIDRKVLGAKVFGKPEDMAKLNRAIGSSRIFIKKAIDQWREALGKDDTLVVEAWQMNSGYGQWCDQMWMVDCEDEIARQRLITQRGLTPEQAQARLVSRLPRGDRADGADFVLYNNGSQEELVTQVRTEYRQVRELWTQGKLPKSRYLDWWKRRFQIR